MFSYFLQKLTSRSLVAVLLILTSLLIHDKSVASESNSVPSAAVGYLDAINVSDNEFSAQGWVASSNPAQKIIAIVIFAGETIIYEGNFEKFERPDVASAMGRNDWVNSGWRVKSAIPRGFKANKYIVTAYAKTDSGEIVGLPINKHASKLEIQIAHSINYEMIIVVICLFGCFLITASAFYFAEYFASKLTQRLKRPVHPGITPILALTFAFICLVAMGTTGSSLEFGLKQTPFVHSDGYRIWGSLKSIRSDEWLVFSPLAISQANHVPAFPVINKNIGEDGQNMLIVGMAGVPVSHISAFAKPATWGFYVFDLKHALSWYWWFPIFGCLFSLWAVFCLISPNHWRIGFLVSLTFCVSPYVTAWSYWPAYAVFFPSLMLFSIVSMLRSRNNVALIGWAITLSLSLAGYVLILYPPWQVSLGYLFLFIGIGLVLRDKLYRNIDHFKIFYFALAFALATFILWKWWLDAGLAINAMMNTVYPGHRMHATGGSLDISALLRGFTNIITLYRMDGVYSNQSEIASFYYLFPSLLILFVLRLREKQIESTHLLLLVFLTFSVLYMLFGIPQELATFTLWGRVSGQRADLAMGLAYILLLGGLLAKNKALNPTYKAPTMFLAIIASLMWGAVVAYAIYKMPHDTLSGFSAGVSVAIFTVIVISSWWLAIGDYRKFLVFNFIFSTATILPFNPMMVSPNALTPIAEFSGENTRVLIANTQIPAMYLLASGKPVSNGVFYYPQKTMWERLDPDGVQANIYNRYQHLIFLLGSVANPYYRIESPQADVVRVVVDTAQFDFRNTGADILVSPSSELNVLKQNPSLVFSSTSDGWARFMILKNGGN